MWEKLFVGMLKSVLKVGRVRVTLPSGRTNLFGDGTGQEYHITIHDAATMRRVLLNPELTVGEAYMDGGLTVDGDDIRGFMAVAVMNLGYGNTTKLQLALTRWRNRMRRWAQYNPMGKAKDNVAHHYDLSGELYDLFLDTDKQYSCAYFRSPEVSLEQAQVDKKNHIAKKLLIEPGMTVLDIGCGWGGMGLTLARDFGAKVIGVTLSEEQHKIANARAKAEGLEDRVEFRLQDYRLVPETFDRIVSVGMFEHVGVPHYREYFSHVRDKLNDDGVAMIHTIGRMTPPGSTAPWIQKYIFPGGYVPSMSETMVAVEHEDLYVTDVEVWRLHYAETLRHWFERFSANREKVKALYDERFCRMWAYYLSACEMTFRHNKQCVFQFQIAKHQEAVPLTREYLYHSDTDQSRMTHAAE